LKLSVRTFLPSGHCDVLWRRASTPVGVSPEALEECVHSCKVLMLIYQSGRHLFQSDPVIFQPALAILRVWDDVNPTWCWSWEVCSLLL
jgi:hypothetical protein